MGISSGWFAPIDRRHPDRAIDVTPESHQCAHNQRRAFSKRRGAHVRAKADRHNTDCSLSSGGRSCSDASGDPYDTADAGAYKTKRTDIRAKN